MSGSLKYIIAFFLLFSTFRANAQYNDIGLMIGGSRYKGELSRHMFSQDFVNFAFGFTYRHNWDRRWSWKLELNFGKISGDDAKAKNAFEIDRNLSFKSHIFEISPQVEFNFFPFEVGRRDYPFTPYLFTGLSIFHFNPQAVLNGEEYDLQPLGTEGQGANGIKKYNRLQFALPVGGGIKVSLGRIGIGIEVGGRRTYTDYLDDVSTFYPDMNILLSNSGPEAVSLSDRSFSRLDTANHSPVFMKQRGNSTDDDWYMFAGVTIFWRLSSSLRDICRPFKPRRY
jgi:hypothetical protein